MSLRVLWNEIAWHFELPNDLRIYLLFHFHTPFVKAERESARIEIMRSCVDMSFYTVLTKRRELLYDHVFELDMRIRDGRIEKLVHMVSEMLCFKRIEMDDKIFGILHKGVRLGIPSAFSALYNHGLIDKCDDVPLYVLMMIEGMGSLVNWTSLWIDHLISIIKYLLEKEMYASMSQLLITNETKQGPVLYSRFFTTDERNKIHTLGLKLGHLE